MSAVQVITITLNPVLDRTMRVNGFRAGDTFVVEDSRVFAGGKGTNVARALSAAGVRAVASGILGSTGSELYTELLEDEGVAHDFLSVPGMVRTNVTIVSGRGPETHLREPGPEVDESIVDRVLERLVSSGAGWAVFGGSLPPGLPPATYRELISSLRESGILSALDASGLPLGRGLEAAPALIKPNLREVDQVLGFTPRSDAGLLKACGQFHAMGVGLAAISLGENGLVLSENRETVHVRVDVPRVVNTVGSGDAALAGCLSGVLAGVSIAETAKLACAMGSANVLISGACRFDPAEVEKLKKRARVRRLR
jgi:1-phosphofructokinase family hexose kinase